MSKFEDGKLIQSDVVVGPVRYDDPVWLADHWHTQQVHDWLVENAEKKVKSEKSLYVIPIIEDLWRTHGRLFSEKEFLEEIFGLSWQEIKYSTKDAKSQIIRSHLPPNVSLYNIDGTNNLLFVPVIQTKTILVPEIEAEIDNQGLPDEIARFVKWLNEYEVVRSTFLKPRSSVNVRGIVKYLIDNFDKRFTGQEIVEKLELNSNSFRQIMDRAIGLVKQYPYQPQLRIIGENDKGNYLKGEFALKLRTEEEIESDENDSLVIQEFDHRELRLEMRDQFLEADKLCITNPNAVTARVSENTKFETTWHDIFARFDEAEKNLLELLENSQIGNIETGLFQPRIRPSISGLNQTIENTIQIINSGNQDTPHQFINIVNDINTTNEIQQLQEHCQITNDDKGEIYWKLFERERLSSWRLILIADYLKMLRRTQPNTLSSDLFEYWQNLIIKKTVPSDGSKPFVFHSNLDSIESVEAEIIRLRKLDRALDDLMGTSFLQDPGFFIKNRKGNARFIQDLEEKFRQISKAAHELSKDVYSTKDNLSITERLEQYLEMTQLIHKQLLAAGKIRNIERYASSGGNMEFIEMKAIILEGNNIVPIYVFNPHYRVVQGDIRVLTDNSTGQIIVGEDGLPILYFDSSIELANSKKREKVNLISLN